MRITFVLYLLVATFVLIYADFTIAENAIYGDNVVNGFRRLRISTHVQEERGIIDALVKFIPWPSGRDYVTAKILKLFANSDSAIKVTDDEVAKMSVLTKKATDDQTIKIPKTVADAKTVALGAKIGDSEMAKVSEMFKNARTGRTGGSIFGNSVGKAFQAAQKEVGLSDDQVSKLSTIFSNLDISDGVLTNLEYTILYKVMNLIENAGANEGVRFYYDDLAKLTLSFTWVQQHTKLTDDQVSMLTKMMANALKVQ